MDQVQVAAQRLRDARQTGHPCAPVRDLIGPADVEVAYAVQKLNIEDRLVNGRRLIGRKIGLTAAKVQAQLGVDQPDFGMLLDDMQCNEAEEIEFHRLMQPKIEAEIAFVLSTPLRNPRNSIEEIGYATKYILPALEIVESRIVGWDIRLSDTIADNASSGRFVLGSAKRRIPEVDLTHCKMAMYRGGQEVSSGVGADCLGSPLRAVAWLADTMVKYGRPLQAGDIVLSGALGPMVAVGAGDVFEATIEGLGTVRASFSRGDR